MKILVIDDEKPTLSMFKLFLTAYGFEVYTAEDGEKGLELYSRTSPDIVFTDIKMPGMDGLEVLRQIRQRSSETQVIIITGHGDMEKAVEALDLDASDFINKPVERVALNSALSRAEKRRTLPADMGLETEIDKESGFVRISMKGKLSGKSGQSLLALLEQQSDWPASNKIHLVLDDSFSINRMGLKKLIEMIQSCIRLGYRVVIKNISYNYVRVFEMAGMDKMAELKEAEILD